MQHLIETDLEVNGAATDASPSSTSSSCASASRSWRSGSSVRVRTPFFESLDFAVVSEARRCLDSISGAETMEIPTLARFKAPTSFVPSRRSRQGQSWVKRLESSSRLVSKLTSTHHSTMATIIECSNHRFLVMRRMSGKNGNIWQ